MGSLPSVDIMSFARRELRMIGQQVMSAEASGGGGIDTDVRSAMISLFQMWWNEPRSDESGELRAEYQRLCGPESPDFVLNLPDYYAFFTYSMFHGKVPR